MSATPIAIDLSRKYVRLIERRNDGFVEFEFALGEPELCAEMLLPAPAFEAFCSSNAVIELPAREAPAAGTDESEEGDDWNWNLRQATHQRFR